MNCCGIICSVTFKSYRICSSLLFCMEYIKLIHTLKQWHNSQSRLWNSWVKRSTLPSTLYTIDSPSCFRLIRYILLSALVCYNMSIVLLHIVWITTNKWATTKLKIGKQCWSDYIFLSWKVFGTNLHPFCSSISLLTLFLIFGYRLFYPQSEPT